MTYFIHHLLLTMKEQVSRVYLLIIFYYSKRNINRSYCWYCCCSPRLHPIYFPFSATVYIRNKGTLYFRIHSTVGRKGLKNTDNNPVPIQFFTVPNEAYSAIPAPPSLTVEDNVAYSSTSISHSSIHQCMILYYREGNKRLQKIRIYHNMNVLMIIYSVACFMSVLPIIEDL